MREFTVLLRDRQFVPVLTSPEMIFHYKRGSASARGGPIDAEVYVTGPRQALFECLDYLRHEIIVYNEYGTDVWWGYISALSAQIGSLQIGISLDEVTNRLKVLYTYKTPENKPLKVESAWVQDADSVAAYGRWETIRSLGNATAQQAAQEIALLPNFSWPVGTPVFGGVGSGGDVVALRCRGWAESLKGTYFVRTDGKVDYTGSGTNVITIGQKYTSNEIGFDPNNHMVWEMGGGMRGFQAGQRIRITDSALNNITTRVVSGTSRDPILFTSTAFYFQETDDVFTVPNSFQDIEAGDLIHMSGADHSSNTGYFWVASVGSLNGQLATLEKIIAKEGPGGPAITLKRGNAVEVNGTLFRETPDGTSTTITTVGEKVAFSWINTGAANWLVYEGWVKLQKYNLPADNMVMELWTDNGADRPGVLLDTATVLGSEIMIGQSNWHKFDFGGTSTVVPLGKYWCILHRSGASAPGNYFQVDVDELAGYTDGTVLLWDGVDWVVPVPEDPDLPAESSIPFSILGREETTEQIKMIIQTDGQFFVGSEVIDTAGILTNQYRDGTLRASSEIEALLNTGANDGRRMLSWVSPERYFKVYKEPSIDTTEDKIQVNLNNEWFDHMGTPLEPGVLPVGKWGEVSGLPAEIGSSTRITPFFAEEATYDADSDELQVTPRGAWTSRSNMGTRQG